ncbi:MAG: MFS transporter [Promethearchaeota archaeon]
MSISIEEILYALYHFPLALTSPFISWYFFFGLSERDFIGSGLIIAIPYFFLIFSTRFFGRLSDKIGSKNLVLISLGTTSVSFMFYFIIEDKFLFFLLYICFNIVISAFNPALNRLMSFYKEERAEKFGRFGMMASIGFLWGSIFAAIAFTYSSNTVDTFRLMFLIAMIISIIPVLFAFRLKETPLGILNIHASICQSNQTTIVTQEINQPMRTVIVLFVIITLINISSSFYVNFFTIFVQDELNHNVSFIASANSIATLLGVFVTYFIGKIADNFQKKKPFILFATILYTLFPLFIYILRDPMIIFLLYCLPFYAILFVIAPIFISENSLETRRGQVMGYYIGSQYFGLTLGTIGGGILASITGLVSPNFLAGAFIGLLGIVICLFMFRESSEDEG